MWTSLPAKYRIKFTSQLRLMSLRPTIHGCFKDKAGKPVVLDYHSSRSRDSYTNAGYTMYSAFPMGCSVTATQNTATTKRCEFIKSIAGFEAVYCTDQPAREDDYEIMTLGNEKPQVDGPSGIFGITRNPWWVFAEKYKTAINKVHATFLPTYIYMVSLQVWLHYNSAWIHRKLNQQANIHYMLAMCEDDFTKGSSPESSNAVDWSFPKFLMHVARIAGMETECRQLLKEEEDAKYDMHGKFFSKRFVHIPNTCHKASSLGKFGFHNMRVKRGEAKGATEHVFCYDKPDTAKDRYQMFAHTYFQPYMPVATASVGDIQLFCSHMCKYLPMKHLSSIPNDEIVTYAMRLLPEEPCRDQLLMSCFLYHAKNASSGNKDTLRWVPTGWKFALSRVHVPIQRNLGSNKKKDRDAHPRKRQKTSKTNKKDKKRPPATPPPEASLAPLLPSETDIPDGAGGYHDQYSPLTMDRFALLRCLSSYPEPSGGVIASVFPYLQMQHQCYAASHRDETFFWLCAYREWRAGLEKGVAPDIHKFISCATAAWDAAIPMDSACLKIAETHLSNVYTTKNLTYGPADPVIEAAWVKVYLAILESPVSDPVIQSQYKVIAQAYTAAKPGQNFKVPEGCRKALVSVSEMANEIAQYAMYRASVRKGTLLAPAGTLEWKSKEASPGRSVKKATTSKSKSGVGAKRRRVQAQSLTDDDEEDCPTSTAGSDEDPEEKRPSVKDEPCEYEPQSASYSSTTSTSTNSSSSSSSSSSMDTNSNPTYSSHAQIQPASQAVVLDPPCFLPTDDAPDDPGLLFGHAGQSPDPSVSDAELMEILRGAPIPAPAPVSPKKAEWKRQVDLWLVAGEGLTQAWLYTLAEKMVSSGFEAVDAVSEIGKYIKSVHTGLQQTDSTEASRVQGVMDKARATLPVQGTQLVHRVTREFFT